MKCLIDYIGVMNCGAVAPPSGVYINQLPGITLKSIDHLANSEQITWVNVWKDVQDRAARKFENSVQKLFASRYKLNRLLVSHCVNSKKSVEPIDYGTPPEAPGGWRGFTIKLNEIDSNSISAFQTIFIESLALSTDIEGVSKVVIFDLNTGNKLFDSGNKTMTVGINKINVNTKFFSTWLFVAYDASHIASFYETLVSENSSTCDCIDSHNCTFSISGAHSISLENINIIAGEDSFGLSGCFNVGCSFESIVCKNKNIFVDAWMNLLGSELMIERLYTERLNAYTTFGKKQAEELRDHFDVQFESSLNDTVDGIQLDDNDCCFHCELGSVTQTSSFL